MGDKFACALLFVGVYPKVGCAQCALHIVPLYTYQPLGRYVTQMTDQRQLSG